MKFNQNHDCSVCQKRCNLFSNLSEEEIFLIDQNRYEVKFKSGEIIFKQGTSATHVISFFSGLAKQYIEGPGDKNLIVKLINPTQILEIPGFYTDKRHHFSIAAIVDSIACFIDQKVFNELMHKNSKFADHYLSEISKSSIKTYERFSSIAQKQMHGRLADVLLYVAQDVFCSNSFDLPLSRQELGEMTSLTKESVIRILKDFASEGFIHLEGSRVTLSNLKALHNISLVG